jgi:hypothetical protein
MAKGSELQAQKWCESKTLMIAPQSCSYIMRNPRATCGFPLGVRQCFNPEEDSVNEKGLVNEASTQYVNRRHEISSRGDITISLRYHDGWFHLPGPY